MNRALLGRGGDVVSRDAFSGNRMPFRGECVDEEGMPEFEDQKTPDFLVSVYGAFLVLSHNPFQFAALEVPAAR